MIRRHSPGRNRASSTDAEAMPKMGGEGSLEAMNKVANSQYSWVYCLYCYEGSEAQVASKVRKLGWGQAIAPKYVRTVVKDKIWIETLAPLLPGYVFVYVREEDMPRAAKPDYNLIPQVRRILSGGEDGNGLSGGNLEFADWLWDLGGKIGVIDAKRVDGHFTLTDERLLALHARVMRVNRGGKKMLVSLGGLSTPLQVWLSYELVENPTLDTRQESCR